MREAVRHKTFRDYHQPRALRPPSRTLSGSISRVGPAPVGNAEAELIASYTKLLVESVGDGGREHSRGSVSLRLSRDHVTAAAFSAVTA